MATLTFGETLTGVAADGRELRSAVFDENQARAAAGITMVAGAVAFAYAYFDQQYVPLRVVATFFLVEFLIRSTAGLRYSPAGIAARWLTSRMPPDWVSAKPKRFAWVLALGLAASMTVITNAGITGYLPRTICAICLVLMWSESVLGLCMGCQIHALMVRRGLVEKDPAFEICAHGACEVPGVEPPAPAAAAGG